MSEVPIDGASFATWSPVLEWIPPCSNLVWYIVSPEVSGPKVAIRRESLLGALCSREEDRNHQRPPTNDINYLGRAMGNMVRIWACEGSKRPKKFYRAVHNRSYGSGIYARGYGVSTSQFDFQIRAEKHFQWDCPEPSPFLSVTDVRETAERWCEVLQEQGRDGIELLEIESLGPGWDHSAQRVWKVEDIVTAFNLEWKPYFKDEYLVEQKIPAERLIRDKWI